MHSSVKYIQWNDLTGSAIWNVYNYKAFSNVPSFTHSYDGILPCKVMTWPSGAICGSVSRSRTLQYVEGRMWEENLWWQYSVVPLLAEPPCKKSRSTQMKKELVFSFMRIICVRFDSFFSCSFHIRSMIPINQANIAMKYSILSPHYNLKKEL